MSEEKQKQAEQFAADKRVIVIRIESCATPEDLRKELLELAEIAKKEDA